VIDRFWVGCGLVWAMFLVAVGTWGGERGEEAAGTAGVLTFLLVMWAMFG
jgi:hypothetical protein